MMAFVGADRELDASRLLVAKRRALETANHKAGFLRDVGIDATQAIADVGQERYGECVERLRRVRPHAHRFGGSHAQRDLIDLSLIAAAVRSSQSQFAQAMQGEQAPRDRVLVGLWSRTVAQRRTSKIKLNGVSAAHLKCVNPALRKTSARRLGPACAPSTSLPPSDTACAQQIRQEPL